jgi:Protein kinase domain
MVKPSLERGSVVDGFLVEECVHRGGMATLWRVSRPGSTMPILMKVPKLGEHADPAAIVSFEMEQMILPRLTGVHVPQFVAAGDLAVQPYIAMEFIPGKTLLARLPDLPLPYQEVAEIGVKVATALDDLHRQHVVHLDVKPSNIAAEFAPPHAARRCVGQDRRRGPVQRHGGPPTPRRSGVTMRPKSDGQGRGEGYLIAGRLRRRRRSAPCRGM